MDIAMSYIEGQKKISHTLNVKYMMELETWNKLIDFGMQKQAETSKRQCDISQERDQFESELFNLTQNKKSKP